LKGGEVLTRADQSKVATAVARQMLNRVAFKMTKENRMKAARGIGAVALSMKTYPFMFLEAFRSMPIAQQGLSIAALLILTGVGGLPGAEDAEDTLDTVAEAFFRARPKFTERYARAVGVGALDFVGIRGELQKDVMDFLAGGLSDVEALHLPSFGGSASMSNIIPGTQLLKPSETDRYAAFLELLGISATMARDLIRSVDAPDLWTGLRGAAPRVVKAGMQAKQQWSTGWAYDTRGQRIAPVSGADAAWQLIGFGAPHVRKMQDFNRDWDSTVKYHEARSNALKDKIAKGMVEGDYDRVQAGWDAVADWNKDFPEFPIVIERSGLKRRMQSATRGLESRIEENAPKAGRGALGAFGREVGYR
jgi:hypothetical protein